MRHGKGGGPPRAAVRPCTTLWGILGDLGCLNAVHSEINNEGPADGGGLAGGAVSAALRRLSSCELFDRALVLGREADR